jgi:hypothetical protein
MMLRTGYVQKVNERCSTLSNCNQNPPLHFFSYKQVYAKDIPPLLSLMCAVVDTRFFHTLQYQSNKST